MILDGLDEIDGRYDTVVRMIKNLADHTNVKICLSSRPLPVFEEAFGGALGLRLQDLTSQTIRDYADVQLSDLIQKRVLHDEQNGHQATRILDTIVARANGVFLWAVIAVRDVRDGLQGIVDLDELAQTVDSLPPELESLFMLMLNRIKPAYQRDAARFLQFVLHAPDRASDWEKWQPPRLTLCNLHLIRSQRDFEDAPFTYKKIPTSEIVQICETLRTQLLSHTAGLLELTTTAQTYVSFDLRPMSQPLLNMELNFLHRTVRDFLCYNDEARSFVARKGFTMPQVHLAIARGRLAQLAQFSDEKRLIDVSHVTPTYYVFRVALQHVSLAERLVEAAQSELMRSLKYESYVRSYSAAHDPVLRVKGYEVDTEAFSYSAARDPVLRVKGYEVDTEAFMIDQTATSIDLVGMAAAVGMTLYVCERLGISNILQGYALKFPGLNDYCTNINTQAILTWTQPSQSEESDESVEYHLHSSSYRQTLGRYLRLNSNVPIPGMASDSDSSIDTDSEYKSRTHSRWANDAFVETYLLSCCAPSSFDLIRILLHAGANPMAVVAPVKERLSPSEQQCFWVRWLELLRFWHFIYIDGRPGRILHDDEYLNLNVTPKVILDITKALLARGADVNFPLDGPNQVYRSWAFEPGDLEDCCLSLKFDATAMFMLETYLNQEPEFRKFAIAIETFIKRPTRRLVGIKALGDAAGDFRADSADLSPGECEMLWPLIEKEEETGHGTDMDALQSAIEGVWKAHRPNWEEDRLKDGKRIEAKEDLEEDLEEDEEEDEEEDGEEEEEEDKAPSVRSSSFSQHVILEIN